MKDSSVRVGNTMKKKFFIAFLTGFLSLGGIIGVFGLSGTAFAMPLGGMGEFFVEFDELHGEDFEFIPKTGETGDSDSAPMVRNKMSVANITNLHIYKDLKLPTGNWVRVHIEAPSASIKGLIQDARFIDANLSFEEMAIKEQNSDDISKNWTQNATKVTIENAKIATSYLFQSMVSLDGAEISMEMIDGPETIE
ncbi:hypothetical protein GCM10008986_03380 [Salinibacillus aidingensis]|uniref:SipW-cognate class signal peptide n=1 Tax=Salinibacillus aidingensis TaxID=237684 RepID=A0ABP3KL50_9BACI